MKNSNFLFLIPFIFGIVSCSGENEETKTSTSFAEQDFEFEIYDSLIVDYLGVIQLMDISPNEDTFLLIDQSTDSMLVADKSGNVLHTFLKKGEGPDDYQTSRTGLAKFAGNDTFIIPTIAGLFQYSLDGKLIKKFVPKDYSGSVSLIIPNNHLHFINDEKIYFYSPGRYSDLGVQAIKYQTGSKQLEIIDMNSGDFESIIPFPSDSKFSSDKNEFGSLDFYPVFNVTSDSLYLAFRNEPKIFTYALSDLENPTSVKPISFPKFIERDTNKEVENGGFNTRDFFMGTMNNIYIGSDNSMLINYLSGLTEEEVNEVMAESSGDLNGAFEKAEKVNTMGYVVFNGKRISPIVSKPTILGNLNLYKSKEEAWFSINFSEAEHDYSVIYKTRLINK